MLGNNYIWITYYGPKSKLDSKPFLKKDYYHLRGVCNLIRKTRYMSKKTGNTREIGLGAMTNDE